MNFESQVMQIPIDDIIPNRFQPRLSFDEKAMEELSASIKEHGVIQPLVLRRVGDKYEIIAGERRYKASTIAGLKEVPAIITNLDDNKSAEVALVENVQRKNLSPIEEAKAFKTILDKGYLTQDGLAKKMGTSQANVANKMRLLNLGSEVQQALIEEKISERHARSLLQIQDLEAQKQMLKRIIDERLTVRQLDTEISNMNNGGGKVVDETPLVDLSPTVEEIKSNAIEINLVKESPSIESMLRPNETPAPVAGAKPVTEVPTGKFFNFLEDEEANMDMGKEEPSIIPASSDAITPMPIAPTPTPIVGPVNEAPTNDIFSNPIAPVNPVPTPIISTVPVTTETDNSTTGGGMGINLNPVANAFEPLNDIATPVTTLAPMPVVEPTPIVEPTPVATPVEVLDVLPTSVNVAPIEPLPQAPVDMVYKEPDTANLIDPVSQIEKLSPDYVPPVSDDPDNNPLVNAINGMRDTLKEIENSGLTVENDEVDLPNVYQFIIKINKPNE